MMNHRIHRQRWQIKAPSTEAAFALRRELRERLDDALLPAFERAFDALAPDGEVIRIPRLTLDIRLHDCGDDPVAALAQALPDVLRERLHDALRARPDVPRRAPSGGDASANPDAALAGAGQAADQPDAPDRARRALLHYLATGRLDWHEQRAQPDRQILHMLRDEAARLAADAAGLHAALVGTLAARLAASFRLLQLLDAGARAAVLVQTALASAPGELPGGLLPVYSALDSLLRQPAAPARHLLLRVQAMRLALREDDLDRPLAAAGIELLRDCQTRLATLAGAEAVAVRADVAALLRAAAPPPAENKTIPPTRRQEAGEDADFLADDAGLVLLHPFLPRLFAALEISRDGQLPDAQLPRAAALLHWLVYGRDDPREYELCIVKVLLGLSPDQPLPVGDGLLAAADRDEAEALLAAAIAHWAALGNTGADALRASFLQRRGLLRDSDSGWQLQLETAPFDLLLGRLPWSFSIVRLPWMTRPLHTEWPLP